MRSRFYDMPKETAIGSSIFRLDVEAKLRLIAGQLHPLIAGYRAVEKIQFA